MKAAEMLWENIVESNEKGIIGNAEVQPTTNGVSACSTASAPAKETPKSGGCGSHDGDGKGGCGCS